MDDGRRRGPRLRLTFGSRLSLRHETSGVLPRRSRTAPVHAVGSAERIVVLLAGVTLALLDTVALVRALL